MRLKAGALRCAEKRATIPPRVNEDNWPRLFKRLCDERGFAADQVDQLIFTQISKPSIAIAAERCPVRLYQEKASEWEFAQQTAQKLGWPDKQIEVRLAPPEPAPAATK